MRPAREVVILHSLVLPHLVVIFWKNRHFERRTKGQMVSKLPHRFVEGWGLFIDKFLTERKIRKFKSLHDV